MMILKYELAPKTPKVVHAIPKDAVFLDVQGTSEIGVMWWLCDPTKDHKDVSFEVVPTGQEFNVEEKIYLGTFLVPNSLGNLVAMHLFQVRA